MKKGLLFLTLLIFSGYSFAQQSFHWYEPKSVQGIGIEDTANIFNRLPLYMKDKVREPVWNLSQHTAGEFLHFKTSATEIQVKFIVGNKNFSMPHMPSTGMSGVDLYAKDVNGVWNWAAGSYKFGDTCSFVFKNLFVRKNRTSVTDFFLYLPLYNSVKWLSIGVDENAKFSFVEKRKEQPIVAYGTSILQGGVTSRPGLAWTNILGRKLDRTVINLGFSGNGRYEAPIFDLMAGIDARLFILDCMPNLTQGYSKDEVKNRLVYGVNKLREGNKNVPILFVENADGGTPFFMDTARLRGYHESSVMIADIFKEFTASGMKNIYLLTEKEIGFDINSTVDGSHPNDIGMMQYAIAYEKKIREIFHEPAGPISTQIPIEQTRDGYDWVKRHEDIIDNIKKTNPETLIIGNSIINFWGGEPQGMVVRGQKEWDEYMRPLKVQNAGFGFDYVQNALWRVYHGELDDFTGKNIVLIVGGNNLRMDTDEDVIKGLQYLIDAIRYRKPGARITMIGILPRTKMEDRIKKFNQKVKILSSKNQVGYVDFNADFLNGNSIKPQLFENDGVHPNAAGYRVLGKNLSTMLKKQK